MSNKKTQQDIPDLLATLPKESKAEDQTPGKLVSVLVCAPVDKTYNYGVPEGLSLRPGDYVRVPLGGREITGVVWGPGTGGAKAAKLKTVLLKYDMPPMADTHRKFIDRVAHYTMSPPGSVLKMALSVPGAFEPSKAMKGYRLPASLRDAESGEAIQNMDCRVEAAASSRNDGVTGNQHKVLTLLRNSPSPRRAADIAQAAGVSPGVIRTMADKGLLETVKIFDPPPCRTPDPHRPGPSLSESQEAAAAHLRRAVQENTYAAALLDGVTGAGKTEVYFEALAEALKKKRQALILLPEIALSNAFLERFEARFGCAPALWHSHLSPAQRKTTWRGVARGEVKVVIGARSALFLPYPDLGLIVVDEEHDPAYKQEDGVIYHARDMAVLRAHLGGFPVVLVSATPSLETMQNIWPPPQGTGRYTHLHLADRFGGACLPDVEIIDMRTEKTDAQHFISLSMRTAIEETLSRGEQALLFLNRRGYAPLTLCRACGHRMECPRCTAWLVEHKNRGALQCHHCGFAVSVPHACPECGEEDALVACGPGVQRITEEAARYFPQSKILTLASDTVDSGQALRDMLEEVRAGRVDIVIGTQIIAKGHHFPNLTLVGVIDADLGLSGGELRASERVYQLLHQVAGRAGREEKKGRVLLQSYMPGHRIMQALTHKGGRDDFLSVEAQERKAAHMPPFSRLAGIIVAGRDERLVMETAQTLGYTAPKGEGLSTFGPAPAPFAKLRGKYRYRLLVQADKKLDLQKTLAHWIGGIKCPSTVRIYIDIDPQSFL